MKCHIPFHGKIYTLKQKLVQIECLVKSNEVILESPLQVSGQRESAFQIIVMNLRKQSFTGVLVERAKEVFWFAQGVTTSP